MTDNIEKPFIAVSLDTYNKKEYLVYSIGNEKFSKIRKLGTLLFDLSGSGDAAAEYLSIFSDMKAAELLTDDFLESQKHLSLNEAHRYSSYDILKKYPDNNESSKLTAFYIQDRLYVAAQNNLKYLLQYYLDTLYANNLFPRKCKCCNGLFLAKTHLFDVLCQTCREKSTAEKTLRYKENHNDDYETQYIKIYQKWYTRIRRAKARGQLTDDKLDLCNELFFRFSSESQMKRLGVKIGDLSIDKFERWIAQFENQMTVQFQEFNVKIGRRG